MQASEAAAPAGVGELPELLLPWAVFQQSLLDNWQVLPMSGNSVAASLFDQSLHLRNLLQLMSWTTGFWALFVYCTKERREFTVVICFIKIALCLTQIIEILAFATQISIFKNHLFKKICQLRFGNIISQILISFTERLCLTSVLDKISTHFGWLYYFWISLWA